MTVPDKRPQRDEDLMMLSGLGLIATDLERALKYRDRARYVQIDEDEVGRHGNAYRITYRDRLPKQSR